MGSEDFAAVQESIGGDGYLPVWQETHEKHGGLITVDRGNRTFEEGELVAEAGEGGKGHAPPLAAEHAVGVAEKDVAHVVVMQNVTKSFAVFQRNEIHQRVSAVDG